MKLAHYRHYNQFSSNEILVHKWASCWMYVQRRATFRKLSVALVVPQQIADCMFIEPHILEFKYLIKDNERLLQFGCVCFSNLSLPQE